MRFPQIWESRLQTNMKNLLPRFELTLRREFAGISIVNLTLAGVSVGCSSFAARPKVEDKGNFLVDVSAIKCTIERFN
jgi:hypothetical protein